MEKILYRITKKELTEQDILYIKQNINNLFMLKDESDYIEKYIWWLYDLSETETETQIIINVDYLFKLCCYTGYTDLAKWLYDLYIIDNDKINIINYVVFEMCCIYNQLNSAKWFFTMTQINVYNKNDFVFRKCCENGYIELVQWLCTLSDKYVINIIDDKIEYKMLNLEDRIKNKINNYDENIKIIDEDKLCPICLSEEIYHVKLNCNHNVCVNCYVHAYDNKKCHYKCDGEINFDKINLIKII